MAANKFHETAMANPNCNFLRKMIARTGIAGFILLLLALGGCSGKSASTSTAARTDSSNAQPNPLQQEITEIASLSKGRVGVSVVVLETGETIAALNSQDHFPMQSVYKL